MNQTRRTFLKGSMATGAVAVAVGAGLLTPQTVLAAWPKAAFTAKGVDGTMSALFGSGKAADSKDIKIKAPDIAENGAVVPVSITAKQSGIESISILASSNPSPLTSSYNLGANTEGYVSTRIKVRKTSKVIAVVKANGKLYTASKDVKVTIGGCGG